MEVLREVCVDILSLSLDCWVSILVLMEVLREVPGKSASDSVRSCFNPCFNGSVERGGFEETH